MEGRCISSLLFCSLLGKDLVVICFACMVSAVLGADVTSLFLVTTAVAVTACCAPFILFASGRVF